MKRRSGSAAAHADRHVPRSSFRARSGLGSRAGQPSARAPAPRRFEGTDPRWMAEGACSSRQTLPASRPRESGSVIEVDPGPPPASRAEPDPSVVVHGALRRRGLLVVNKPAGLVVHPARGTGRERSSTACSLGASVSRPPTRAIRTGAMRPGIVHRIDKDTSGLLVVAKTVRAREALKAQLSAHTVERRYRLTHGVPSAGGSKPATGATAVHGCKLHVQTAWGRGHDAPSPAESLADAPRWWMSPRNRPHASDPRSPLRTCGSALLGDPLRENAQGPPLSPHRRDARPPGAAWRRARFGAPPADGKGACVSRSSLPRTFAPRSKRSERSKSLSAHTKRFFRASRPDTPKSLPNISIERTDRAEMSRACEVLRARVSDPVRAEIERFHGSNQRRACKCLRAGVSDAVTREREQDERVQFARACERCCALRSDLASRARRASGAHRDARSSRAPSRRRARSGSC